MTLQFNIIDIVTDLLDTLGYFQKYDHNRSLSCGEYNVATKFVLRPQGPQRGRSLVRVRTKTDKDRVCILRISGQKVHIHGSQIDCNFIDFTDPGSLDTLHNALSSIEKPNGNPGQS